MKKIKKRVLTFLLTCTIVLGSSTPVLAQEDTISSMTINEYDRYIEIRSSNTQQLLDEGLDAETIETIKSDNIEERLKELSKLSRDELFNMGYNDKQIEIFQNYSGEHIEDAPELRAAFGTLSASVSKVKASTNSLALKYEWNWSQQPQFSGPSVYDIVGIDWKGSDSGGSPLNLAYSGASSFCDIFYHSNADGAVTRKSYTIKDEGSYSKASVTFPMSFYTGTGNPQINHWAKNGSVIITVNKIGSKNIKEAAFVFGYGHSTIFGSPSISLVPPGAGIAFSSGVTSMDKSACRLTSSGQLIQN